jgi:hypothetical protein
MGWSCGMTASVWLVLVMSAPRKPGARVVYGAGGTMNFQPGPETIC